MNGQKKGLKYRCPKEKGQEVANMNKSLNYAEKLANIASKNIFGKPEDNAAQEKETVYVFGPAGMIVLA